MLLQHHTAALLTPTVREGWEEEMEEYFDGVGEETAGDEAVGKGMAKRGSKRKRRDGGESTSKNANAKQAQVIEAEEEAADS